uniref:BTB domain-containing protein n=1 Tax=Chromera velia CCMP2878 TaxID=1169474 RepID=A0A0G4I761_9ALVE|mmetsp:Transcript_24128/g.47394  ORF Transcript_24128/g.47394 Transcript_24128/m.47394 type:complete len:436 (-) Transcript_24128:635-1942(-)|eukprot:Cvel_11575.t1-p1 / transcript=Cvel_11575.t1 / gene=Cvel_11575 / organism=Chromera_velia_CCMP2878 / gene_product=hypothetical protein / transcript_product=hypothetical protein / location=Cvel_scaffold732:1870-8152(-) / protein_length=435 / sequence_SO=supercontig / SO=protein_coding / is_pseudo=false
MDSGLGLASKGAVRKPHKHTPDCLKLISDPAFAPLFDIALVAEGKEIRAHRCILASNSAYFFEQFCGVPNPPARIEFPSQRYSVIRQLIRYLYGDELDEQTPPDEIMELLSEARALGIPTIQGDDFYGLVVPRLTFQNCLTILQHEELVHQPLIGEGVVAFVTDHFFDLIQHASLRDQMLGVHRRYLMDLLRAICSRCCTDQQAKDTVQFAVEWSQFETACDLLKDCKNWPWNHDPTSLSYFKPLPDDPMAMAKGTEIKSVEWQIPQVKRALRDQLPVRLVSGALFDWGVRIDHGAEGKIRIVYESATEVEPQIHACMKRFPAAMFAWQVIFRGNNVFHERPVFICFPQGVSLHWSTTLPIATAELSEEDHLTILVSMVENPLVSLILYHFSADLGNTMATEDILNRLPHIEYRCLSSYSLYQQAKGGHGSGGFR